MADTQTPTPKSRAKRRDKDSSRPKPFFASSSAAPSPKPPRLGGSSSSQTSTPIKVGESSKLAQSQTPKPNQEVSHKSNTNGPSGSGEVSAQIPVSTTKPEKRSRSKKESKKHRSHKATTSSWDCIPVAQSEVSRIPPVWSNDGRFYFTAANTSVFVHSSMDSSFPRLSTLSSTHPLGHRKPITSLILHPTNPLQLITSSEDGSVKVWDWVEGRLIRTIRFVDNGSVSHICCTAVGSKWWIFGTVTNPKPGKLPKDDDSHLQHRLMRVPLLGQPQSTTPDKPIAYLYLVGKLRSKPAAVMVSPRSTYIVVLAGRKAYVYRLPRSSPIDDKWQAYCVKFVSDQQFTCGSFAPEKKLGHGEEWFATGDERGIIRLWHGLGEAFRQLDSDKPIHSDTEKRLPTTSLHWHAHAVAAIAFTPSGAQLLSVGEESVLVQWHLASGKREYIPRLGGRPILSVAIRRGARATEDEYWMGFADGSMMRVGATSGSVSSVGQAVRLDPLRPILGADRNYPLAIHPSSKATVVPSSHPSTLQFIDPLAAKVLFDLEVAPSNRVSRRDEKQLDPIAVERVVFSLDASWMATIEGRKADEVEGGGMVKTLKIWKWTGDKYLVNTQFPRPHGISEITSLVFSASQLLTASIDGTAKIWHYRQAKKSEHVYWTTRSTFSYRSLPVYATAFSPDGTLAALAHGSAVTFWDAESNVLLRVLDCGVTLDARRVSFVGTSGRHIVAAGLKQGLAVWDLLSCELIGELPGQAVRHFATLPNGFLTADSSSNSTTLSIFTPNLQLIRTATISTTFTAIAPLPLSSSINLVGISPSGEIWRFGESESASSSAPMARSVLAQKQQAQAQNQSRATSIWQEMFGKDAFLDDLETMDEIVSGSNHNLNNSSSTATSTAGVSAIQARAKGRPTEIYNGPSHTLPPVSMLFDAFIDELLVSTKGKMNEESGTNMDSTENGTIIYEVDPKTEVGSSLLDSRVLVNGPNVRLVKDDDLVELEKFFSQLLSKNTFSTSSNTGQAASSQSKNKLKQRHGLSNGSIIGDLGLGLGLGGAKSTPALIASRNLSTTSTGTGTGTPNRKVSSVFNVQTPVTLGNVERVSVDGDESGLESATKGSGGSSEKWKKRKAKVDID